MDIWTIYYNPRDYPGLYVARKFINDRLTNTYQPTQDIFTADTLDKIRNKIPPYLTCITRYPEDERQIVESWI